MSLCHSEIVGRKWFQIWKILLYLMGGLNLQAELCECLCCKSGPSAASLISPETQDSVTAPWCCSLRVLWWCVSTALTNVFDVGGLGFVLFVCLRVTGVLRFLIACYTVIPHLMYLTLTSACLYLKVLVFGGLFFWWLPDRLWIFVYS